MHHSGIAICSIFRRHHLNTKITAQVCCLGSALKHHETRAAKLEKGELSGSEDKQNPTYTRRRTSVLVISAASQYVAVDLSNDLWCIGLYCIYISACVYVLDVAGC